MIKEDLKNKNIKGVKVSRNLSITHLLFVEDVLLFGVDSISEWGSFLSITDSFYDALGMAINAKKFVFLYSVMIKLFVSRLHLYFHFN